jgi:hypothetical protein
MLPTLLKHWLRLMFLSYTILEKPGVFMRIVAWKSGGAMLFGLPHSQTRNDCISVETFVNFEIGVAST